MKKLVSLLLICTMLFAFGACGKTDAEGGDFKVGVILIGDDTEGYTKAHMDGIKAAAESLGMAENDIIWKYKVTEDSKCYDAAADLVASGCDVIISNSYGHQTYMVQAAEEFSDVPFVAMTGDFAAICGVENLSNAFTKVFESRYVSGVVAGLKLKELVESGTLTTETQADSFDADGNIKIGYVGAFDYAEVVSGYTAFYLGIKSVMPNVVMEVKYTNSWFDIDKEAAAAEALIANGAVIIGQHADSTGAPAATEKLLNNGRICYSVGYNVDMLETAPNAALTSATNNWSAYYTEALTAAKNGEEIAVNWAEGYEKDAVAITTLGPSCAAGTAEYVADVEAQLKAGTLEVFDTDTFTVSAAQNTCTVETDAEGKVTSCKVDMSFMDFATMTAIYEGEVVECIENGAFEESSFRSAPYFSIRIDGIVENATPVE
ncbi:MAG: BMP family ABC transporter substrate-binding protein [Lachnospiraceae bacterium]|nr:BMP family ABC transporter substrate-binding protein [Lachnospiraceae bacterium]